jgi:preprotein translocase subunit YajC
VDFVSTCQAAGENMPRDLIEGLYYVEFILFTLFGVLNIWQLREQQKLDEKRSEEEKEQQRIQKANFILLTAGLYAILSIVSKTALDGILIGIFWSSSAWIKFVMPFQQQINDSLSSTMQRSDNLISDVVKCTKLVKQYKAEASVEKEKNKWEEVRFHLCKLQSSMLSSNLTGKIFLATPEKYLTYDEAFRFSENADDWKQLNIAFDLHLKWCCSDMQRSVELKTILSNRRIDQNANEESIVEQANAQILNYLTLSLMRVQDTMPETTNPCDISELLQRLCSD